VRATLAGATARLLLDPVLAVVFAPSCPACARTLSSPTRGPLCEGCWAALPRHRTPLCRCGVPLAAGESCGRCRRGLTPYAAGASLGPYAGVLRTAIHELKYRGRRRVAARLADALLDEPCVRELVAAGAVLVPVPLHPRRQRERGFNQAEWLAAELARRAPVQLSPDALVRRKETAPQTGLSASARRANVRGAFAVRRRSQVDGRVVVLVDDVLTTGATALACAQALRQAGAAQVRLLTAARVA
jgi:ComF family protein